MGKVSKYNIRYKYMLCDGDSSSYMYNAIRDVYGVGHQVQKLDCVGHVGKRMYKA